MSNLPAKDPGYLDAEWREVPEVTIETKPCPHCGKLTAPVFGQCYHCFRDLRPKGFWATFWEAFFKPTR